MRTRILTLTDEEFDDFVADIAAVMDKYEKEERKTDARKRSISFISAPVEEAEQ